jgi:hypothetical protein
MQADVDKIFFPKIIKSSQYWPSGIFRGFFQVMGPGIRQRTGLKGLHLYLSLEHSHMQSRTDVSDFKKMYVQKRRTVKLWLEVRMFRINCET